MNAETDRLVSDLQRVKGDAESLISEVAKTTTDGFGAVRERIESRLSEVKGTLGRARNAVTERAKHAGDVSHQYVVEHPWKSLAVVAALGVVVGMLIRRN